MRPNTSLPINAGDATATSVTSSKAIDVRNVYAISMQAIAVAPNTTITGTLKLQYSNDPGPTGASTNWCDVPSGSISVSQAGVSGLTGGFLQVCYQWLQVVYTKGSSSTGATITAQVATQGY